MPAPGSTTALAGALRGRLGPSPDLADLPLVSIIVVTRDGAGHLRRLLAGLVERTDYPCLELIVVDNGSTDDSVEFLRSVAAPFPVSIVTNPSNESFSDANNQGAARASGELLLFLNNDIEPFESGWLRELIACRRDAGEAAIGATLVFPHDDLGRFPYGFAVQHRGLRFRDEDGVLGPALHEWEADPFDQRLGEDIESAVVVAACLLVDTKRFGDVGGFTHGYFYGAEDVDLCLKLHTAGGAAICSGRSVLIHRPGSTRRTIALEKARKRKLSNHRLLLERWGPRLRREHDLDALAGGGRWVQLGREQGASACSRTEAEALGICVKIAAGPDADAETSLPEELRASAAARGHRCSAIAAGAQEDLRSLEYDIAIHVGAPSRHRAAPGQFSVLWVGESHSDLTGAECEPYDLVLTCDSRLAIKLRATSSVGVAFAPGSGEAVLNAVLAAVHANGYETRIAAAAESRNVATAPMRV